ncbi:MAG: hypothetical protein FWE53_01180 [Firmicutes bacterium]|nr:hypothetical protein [Bacillota bacterium]
MERKVYINNLDEVKGQSAAYRVAKPVSDDLGIWTNSYGQSYEFTRCARAGSDIRVEFVFDDGVLAWYDAFYKDAGFRPALQLIFNPQSPREAREINYEVMAWDDKKSEYVKTKVTKHVLDIKTKDGTTVEMQIDNWDEIKKGNAKTYKLKTLHSIKAQAFNKNGSNIYKDSDIDKACDNFYNNLAQEVQRDVCTVVMDEKTYEITDVKQPQNTAKDFDFEQLVYASKGNIDAAHDLLVKHLMEQNGADPNTGKIASEITLEQAKKVKELQDKLFAKDEAGEYAWVNEFNATAARNERAQAGKLQQGNLSQLSGIGKGGMKK